MSDSARSDPMPVSEPVVNPPDVSVHLLAADGDIPNNPRLPLLAYRSAVTLSGRDPAWAFETLFARHGWPDGWRNGIFGYHHYHSTAHEVLGIYSGQATVRLGGEGGITLTVGPGDAVIIPAGVGHKRLDSQGSLGVVGAYPTGQHPDLCRGGAAAHAGAVERVPLPAMDPVYGDAGPLRVHWPGT